MTQEEISKLRDNWINGNQRDVIDTLASHEDPEGVLRSLDVYNQILGEDQDMVINISLRLIGHLHHKLEVL